MKDNSCREYEIKGYCLLGHGCPYSHGCDNKPLELDVSKYNGLMGAKRKAVLKHMIQMREEQNKLKRKQKDLLNNLISQQRLLLEKIEACQDETERSRLKIALDEMSQKTKDWLEQEKDHLNVSPSGSASNSSSSPSTVKIESAPTASGSKR